MPREESVNEENQTGENQPERKLLPPETRKKITYVLIVLLLMGASFAAGWYLNNSKSKQTNPADLMNAGMQSTPPPAATPVPVTEEALKVINFTGVSAAKKASVMAAFNTELCACGCKMSVAECIVRDLHCPLWNDHVTRFQKALGNGKKPNLSKVPRPQGAPMPPGIAMPNGMVMPNGMNMPKAVELPKKP